MVVVSHLFLFLRKSFRGRFDSCESNLPLFGTIYFPTARFSSMVLRGIPICTAFCIILFRKLKGDYLSR